MNTSVDTDGHPLYPGDMRAQLEKAFDNLELVLEQAGLKFAGIAMSLAPNPAHWPDSSQSIQ